MTLQQNEINIKLEDYKSEKISCIALFNNKSKKIIYEGAVNDNQEPHGYGELYSFDDEGKREYIYSGYWSNGDVPSFSLKETGYFTLGFTSFYGLLSILISMILDIIPSLEVLLDTTIATGVCAGLIRQIALKGDVMSKNEFIAFQRLLKILLDKSSNTVNLDRQKILKRAEELGVLCKIKSGVQHVVRNNIDKTRSLT